MLEQKSGRRNLSYTIPLQINFAGSTLESCFLPAMESGRTLLCRQLHGTYNLRTQKCDLSFYGKNCLERLHRRGKLPALHEYF